MSEVLGHKRATVSLPPSVREQKGQLVCFEPWYGWGWYRLCVSDEHRSVDFAMIAAAGVFHIRVHRVFDVEGQPRGLIGQVEQIGHLFDGLWVATWTMLVGAFDLTENLCWRWDIELGSSEPQFKDGWPLTPDTPPAFAGHGGVLAVSHAAIRLFRERMLEWKPLPSESKSDVERGVVPGSQS